MWRDVFFAVGGVGAVLGLWLAITRWAAGSSTGNTALGEPPGCESCSSAVCSLHQQVQPQGFHLGPSTNDDPKPFDHGG